MRYAIRTALAILAAALGLVLFQVAATSGETQLSVKSIDAVHMCAAPSEGNPNCTVAKKTTKLAFGTTPPTLSFCGQCSTNSDCGTCRCTGPSDGSCNECVCP